MSTAAPSASSSEGPARCPVIRFRLSPSSTAAEAGAAIDGRPLAARAGRLSVVQSDISAELLNELDLRLEAEIRIGTLSIPLSKNPLREPLLLRTAALEGVTRARIRVRAGSPRFAAGARLRARAPANARVASWQLAFSQAIPLGNVVSAVLNVHALLEGTTLKRIGAALAAAHLGWVRTLAAMLLSAVIGCLWQLEQAGFIAVKLTGARAYTARWDAALVPAWSGYVQLCWGRLTIPFWDVKLPHFVLPPPLASLDALFSPQAFGSHTRLVRAALPSLGLARAAHDLASTIDVALRLRGRAPALEVRLTLPDLTDVTLNLRALGEARVAKSTEATAEANFAEKEAEAEEAEEEADEGDGDGTSSDLGTWQLSTRARVLLSPESVELRVTELLLGGVDVATDDESAARGDEAGLSSPPGSPGAARGESAAAMFAQLQLQPQPGAGASPKLSAISLCGTVRLQLAGKPTGEAGTDTSAAAQAHSSLGPGAHAAQPQGLAPKARAAAEAEATSHPGSLQPRASATTFVLVELVRAAEAAMDEAAKAAATSDEVRGRGLDLSRALPVTITQEWGLATGSQLRGIRLDASHKHPLMRGGAMVKVLLRDISASGSVWSRPDAALPVVALRLAVADVRLAAGKNGRGGASLRGSRLHIWPEVAGGSFAFWARGGGLPGDLAAVLARGSQHSVAAALGAAHSAQQRAKDLAHSEVADAPRPGPGPASPAGPSSHARASRGSDGGDATPRAPVRCEPISFGAECSVERASLRARSEVGGLPEMRVERGDVLTFESVVAARALLFGSLHEGGGGGDGGGRCSERAGDTGARAVGAASSAVHSSPRPRPLLPSPAAAAAARGICLTLIPDQSFVSVVVVEAVRAQLAKRALRVAPGARCELRVRSFEIDSVERPAVRTAAADADADFGAGAKGSCSGGDGGVSGTQRRSAHEGRVGSVGLEESGGRALAALAISWSFARDGSGEQRAVAEDGAVAPLALPGPPLAELGGAEAAVDGGEAGRQLQGQGQGQGQQLPQGVGPVLVDLSAHEAVELLLPGLHSGCVELQLTAAGELEVAGGSRLSSSGEQTQFDSSFFRAALDPASEPQRWARLFDTAAVTSRLVRIARIAGGGAGNRLGLVVEGAVDGWARFRRVLRELKIEQPLHVIPAERMAVAIGALLSDDGRHAPAVLRLILRVNSGLGLDVIGSKKVLEDALGAETALRYAFELDRSVRWAQTVLSPSDPLPPRPPAEPTPPLTFNLEHSQRLAGIPSALELWRLAGLEAEEAEGEEEAALRGPRVGISHAAARSEAGAVPAGTAPSDSDSDADSDTDTDTEAGPGSGPGAGQAGSDQASRTQRTRTRTRLSYSAAGAWGSHAPPSLADAAPLLCALAPLLSLPQLRALTARGRPARFPARDWATLLACLEVKTRVDALHEHFGGITCVPQAWDIAQYLGAVARLSGATARLEGAVPSPPPSPPSSPATRRAQRWPLASSDGVAAGAEVLAVAVAATDTDTAGSHSVTQAVSGALSTGGPSNGGRPLTTDVECVSARVLATWGSALLGPAETALLLRAGLSSAWQGRVVQLNQRLLLELLCRAPRAYALAALSELGAGSVRQLAGALFALLEVEQESFAPEHRLDIPLELGRACGVELPCRAEYMMQGRLRDHSYYADVTSAAERIARGAVPWEALKSRLHVAYRRGFGGRPARFEQAAAGQGLAVAQIAGLPPSLEVVAQSLVHAADVLGAQCAGHWHSSGQGWPQRRASAADAYLHASTAVAALLARQPSALGAEWVRAFFARHVEALQVLAIVRTVQRGDDGGRTRRWLAATHANATATGQPLPYGAAAFEKAVAEADARARLAASTSARLAKLAGLGGGGGEGSVASGSSSAVPGSQPLSAGLSSARAFGSEQGLLECVVRCLYFEESCQRAMLDDPLVRLLIDPPPPGATQWSLTLISAMGVITEGAKGNELERTYRRLATERGVTVLRADTGTVRGLEYNAKRIVACMRAVRTRGWAWIGYSQGCTNSFYAEHILATGTPADARLLRGLRCRQLLFSAANGSAHSTCGEAKIRAAITAAEHGLKHHQAHFSPQATTVFLRALQGLFESRAATDAFGGLASLSFDGVGALLWTGAAHRRWVPTGAIRGVVEAHSLPEALQQFSNTLSTQIESARHDTQVSADTAVGHPVHVSNANARMLRSCALPNRVQRTHHWSPLDEATDFVTTQSDRLRCVYESPKDRHVIPYLEACARFGLIDVLPA